LEGGGGKGKNAARWTGPQEKKRNKKIEEGNRERCLQVRSKKEFRAKAVGKTEYQGKLRFDDFTVLRKKGERELRRN